MGWTTVAGPVAYASCARARDRHGDRARNRHRRHPAIASHRVPRRVRETRRRSTNARIDLLLRSLRLQRRAVRRRHARLHAESARRRDTDVARPDSSRHLGESHDQRHDRAPSQSGTKVAASMAAGRARQRYRRSRRIVRRTPRNVAASGGSRRRTQRLCAGAARGSVDGGTRRTWPRRSSLGVGRDGLRAGTRPASVRRRSSIADADGLVGRRVS